MDEDWVYWSDWTSHSVWRTGKHGGCELELVKSFKSSKPHGIVAIPVEKCNMSLCKTRIEAPERVAKISAVRIWIFSSLIIR